MEFVMTMKKDDVTMTVSCPDLTDPVSLQHITALFDIQNAKYAEKVTAVKRGRGRPRKGEKK